MVQETESMNNLFKRLEEIRLKLNNSQPDLDNMMPLYDEANEIETKLNTFYVNTKKTINDKKAQRNNA